MITVRGEGLSIEEIVAVARGARVALTEDPMVLDRVRASCAAVEKAVAEGQPIYGVSTLYGGMADRNVPQARMAELQHAALWHHKTATGPRLSREDVRAAMLLRVNSLVKGYSAVRVELIGRYLTFLNAGVTPHVHQRGSIGASGDLAPLSYIGAAVVGLDEAFLVDFGTDVMGARSALARLGLQPLELRPKEGLALNNGTAASTGVAANCLARTFDWLSVGIGVHALYAQAMLATSQSFHATIHELKPHPGQVWVAAQMRALLAGSALIRNEAAGARQHRAGKLIQDRYGLRCLPQYIGPIVDAIALAAQQIETEANSANDNPLIDPVSGEVYHTGNFLAQYPAVAMDQLRLQLAMFAKHLDVQIAMLVTPEFSQGLSASLVGNREHGLNVGLKSLQVSCNALAPLLHFYARSMADLYPTHAEQFNQNINSQAMNAANLAAEALGAAEHFMANALLFAVQAIELRAQAVQGSCDATALLSPATRPLYLAARTAAGGPPRADQSLIWNDMDGFIQPKVEALLSGIGHDGAVTAAVAPVTAALARFRRH